MSGAADADRVRAWIDDDLVASVEAVEDPAAEFNLMVELSGLALHVIRQRPDGPLLVGQQIEFDDAIRDRIRSLPEAARGELVSRIRAALMEVPVVYGFQDEHDANVGFEDVHHIFVERRLYGDAATQQSVMDALVDVWKALRYLDDIWALMDAVEA